MDKAFFAKNNNRIMISIIIITHNRSGFLKRTLSALTKQKRKADEVIVVDNGSKDKTKKVVLSYKNKLPIKYVSEKRKGYGIARNAGVKKADGKIILCIDDDCLADENWTLILERELEKGAHIAGGSKKLADNNIFSQTDYFITVAPVLNPTLKRTERFTLSSSNLAIRKEVFDKIGFFDENLPLAEDRNFLIKAKDMGFKIIFCPSACVYDIGLSKNLKFFLARMKRYGSGIMFSYLVHGEKEPMSRFFPKNALLLTILSPIYITLETVYTVAQNLKHAPSVLFFIPLIIVGFAAWHYGIILGLREYRGKYVSRNTQVAN